MTAVWEYRYSANEKERKDAAAKIKRKQEQKELTEALEVRSLTLTRAWDKNVFVYSRWRFSWLFSIVG